MLHAERGDLVGAEAAWRRRRTRPRRGRIYLGLLLANRGDFDAERGSADGALIRGVPLKDRGDLVGAEAAYRHASERGVAAGAFNLGVLLYEHGDFRGRRGAFLRAMERAVIEGNMRLAEKSHDAETLRTPIRPQACPADVGTIFCLSIGTELQFIGLRGGSTDVTGSYQYRSSAPP